MFLKMLKDKLARLEAKKTKLAERSKASTDAAEVRSLTDELEELNGEIAETRAMIETLEKQAKEEAEEQRSVPAGATLVNADVAGAVVGKFAAADTAKREDEDIYASMEYRRAFMAYAQRGTEIPAKFATRDGSPANTDTLGATIPTTVLNEFINEIRLVYGNLYRKVRKMNIKGAVKVPIARLEASFKWINESTVAPREDGGEIKEYVEFSYNMAEIRVSQTLLSEIVDIGLFEREIVGVMITAYLRAMDKGIMKGTGVGEMLGILNDPRVMGQSDHIIEMTAADFGNWTAWRKKFFAKLPLGYRAGEFIFPLATVDTYLETMADANNNPIFRQATGLEVNDGDNANPNGRFFGREVSLVEPDIIADFDSASDGDVVGVFWQPAEYAINTNLAFGMRRYRDEERNEWVNKMLTVVDGKVLNPKGFYIIKKKA
jgi:HK97 family phage major capsid protein